MKRRPPILRPGLLVVILTALSIPGCTLVYLASEVEHLNDTRGTTAPSTPDEENDE